MEKVVLDGELIKDNSPVDHIYCTDSMASKEYLENLEKDFHPVYGSIFDKTNITCYNLDKFNNYNEIFKGE